VADAESLLRQWMYVAEGLKISIRHCLHPLPCSSQAPATARTRSIQVPDGIASEAAEGLDVDRDDMTGTISSHNLLKPRSLLGKRQIRSMLERYLHILELRSEPLALRPPPQLERLAILLGPANMR